MKKLLLVAIGFIFGSAMLTACATPPTPDERLVEFIRLLEADRFKLDKTDSPDGPAYNADWDTETEIVKKRQIKVRTVTIRKGDKIAEVVVVAPKSNCKVQVEVLLHGDLHNYYGDKGVGQNGETTALLDDFPRDLTPESLEIYVNNHEENELAYCADKVYEPSKTFSE